MPVRVDRGARSSSSTSTTRRPPLADVLGAIPAEVAAAGYDVEHMRLVERRDYIIECNWKVYVDNYLEGYHLPDRAPAAVQGARLRRLPRRDVPLLLEAARADPRAEAGRGAGRRSALHAPADGEEDSPSTTGSSRTRCSTSTRTTCRSNVILPLGPDRTLTIFEWFFAEPGTRRGLGDRCSRRSPSPTRSSRRTSSSASRCSAACAHAPTTRAASQRQARERRLPLPAPRPGVLG